LKNGKGSTSLKPRALVIRLSSLGDLVLSTSVVEPLHEAGYEVSFVTKTAFSPILLNHPNISSVFSYGDSPTEAKNRKAFFDWLEIQKFSLIVDLQDSLRTRLWRRRLRKNAELWVAKKERIREILILVFRLRKTFSFGRGGRALKFRRLILDNLAKKNQFPFLKGGLTSLFVTKEEIHAAKVFLPAKNYAVILPSSAWKSKEWPYFDELANVIKQKYEVLFLGGKKDLICDEFARKTGGISLRGKTSLRESMAILQGADLIVGNDTGFVHVAEAMGKDVVMIEGPTHKTMGFSPYRPKSLLVGKNLFCRPCSKSGKICWRLGSRACLRDLGTQEVLAQMRKGGLSC
jgi:heptosyltransferase II